jgi:hypothetical protein
MSGNMLIISQGRLFAGEAMPAYENVDVPPPFEWGGCVRLRSNAAGHYPIREGSVCGVRRVETVETATKFGTTVGSLLLLVEGADGEAFEIPIEFLEVG